MSQPTLMSMPSDIQVQIASNVLPTPISIRQHNDYPCSGIDAVAGFSDLHSFFTLQLTCYRFSYLVHKILAGIPNKITLKYEAQKWGPADITDHAVIPITTMFISFFNTFEIAIPFPFKLECASPNSLILRRASVGVYTSRGRPDRDRSRWFIETLNGLVATPTSEKML
ncbi:hypothetical protein TI39_contig4202g00043 [Zymoseptoria brevis]|uniref:Uncharacterized protein n=1 Tax=Zymoseptoria brevis TaxID=1047168 RepID=A0A0F4GDR9_9PEZI|nr:hypothetical protein TI39_contig4202g00043 [Zymoseptoria brevis]